MRRGEILALRWRDVDLDGAVLSVVRSLEQTKAGLAFKAPKNGKGRAIALPAATVEALRRHRTDQAELRLKLGLGRDDDGLVVCKYDGEAVRPRTLSLEFARLVKRVPGIPVVTFHGLRHSNVTHQLQLGVPIKVVSERAGHSSASFTLDRYGHVLQEMQVDAAKRLDAAFRASSKGKGV
jgi:integrase